MTLMASGLGGFGLYTEIIGTSACMLHIVKLDYKRTKRKLSNSWTWPQACQSVFDIGV